MRVDSRQDTNALEDAETVTLVATNKRQAGFDDIHLEFKTPKRGSVVCVRRTVITSVGSRLPAQAPQWGKAGGVANGYGPPCRSNIKPRNRAETVPASCLALTT